LQDALDREPLPPVENNYASVADALHDGKVHRIRSSASRNQQPTSTGVFHTGVFYLYWYHTLTGSLPVTVRLLLIHVRLAAES